MKLFIDNVGMISAVYDDALAGMDIGEVRVKRASNVEFNHETGKWEARSCSLSRCGELLASGTNRTEVIKQEVLAVEQQLRELHVTYGPKPKES